MSYTPTNWQTGDTVTAALLNKMEQGIETAVDPFVVTLTPTAEDMSGTMDKTVEEITEAYYAGKRILFTVPFLYISFDATMYIQNGLDTVSCSAIVYFNEILLAITTDTTGYTYHTEVITSRQ